MDHTVEPGSRSGHITVPASKSYAHRLLICAALADAPAVIECDGISKDIEATIECLKALGAKIEVVHREINVDPKDFGKVSTDGDVTTLNCGESGSTLRFLIPVVGALGINAVFNMEGRLKERPNTILTDELSKHGMSFKQEDNLLYVSGRLESGDFNIAGNISSQYVSGLLFALPVLSGKSTLTVTGEIESKSYIDMTEDVLESMDIEFDEYPENCYRIPGDQIYSSHGREVVERDWSNAAFFVCMGALSDKGITLDKLSISSKQGDRAILDIVKRFGAYVYVGDDSVTVKKKELKAIELDASNIPDLVPVVSVLAGLAEGTTKIYNAGRLRIKESDRLATTAKLINSLGGRATETNDGLLIEGVGCYKGGTVDAFKDHRIAMSAAVCACGAVSDITILGAECVSKSYPAFFLDFNRL